jgi:hypothetical protein
MVRFDVLGTVEFEPVNQPGKHRKNVTLCGMSGTLEYCCNTVGAHIIFEYWLGNSNTKYKIHFKI